MAKYVKSKENVINKGNYKNIRVLCDINKKESQITGFFFIRDLKNILGRVHTYILLFGKTSQTY
ncbi:hypothetical protein CN558_23925 [Bacillus wiedmannii]|uniref:hypothetical protein n=1 Tax=Bacillus wiedmannii TaxID=1890302 RepID=UPI000BF04D49|nr:hypothetical protein [Bacillus wiedmannii]PEM93726.1 hypothetical protein CN627_00115 [Bacillus wiedmannii]PEO82196.1 hypothetical protein CN558_23925 [Bacillus wiedmannii]